MEGEQFSVIKPLKFCLKIDFFYYVGKYLHEILLFLSIRCLYAVYPTGSDVQSFPNISYTILNGVFEAEEQLLQDNRKALLLDTCHRCPEIIMTHGKCQQAQLRGLSVMYLMCPYKCSEI